MRPTEDNKRVILPSGQRGYWTGETGPNGSFYEIKTYGQDRDEPGYMYHHDELERQE